MTPMFGVLLLNGSRDVVVRVLTLTLGLCLIWRYARQATGAGNSPLSTRIDYYVGNSPAAEKHNATDYALLR